MIDKRKERLLALQTTVVNKRQQKAPYSHHK